ncbi:Growth arrest-specific protein 1 [Dirofilaria immitis]|nr:Growth arrest-specific protein 1 [Dirofilaria immitis]
MQQLFLFLLLTKTTGAQSPNYSVECQRASAACEENTDCVHRLAVLQSTCVTNTCQPQCRNAVLNLYQNRLGRSLLRTDISCIPSRYELELCNLIPHKLPVYCNLAKLACEADLMCSSRFGMFTSECERETIHDDCSPRCRELLNDTLKTQQGSAFIDCTCTDKDDKLYNNSIFEDITVQPNMIMHGDNDDRDGGRIAGTSQFLLIVLFCTLLIFR